MGKNRLITDEKPIAKILMTTSPQSLNTFT